MILEWLIGFVVRIAYSGKVGWLVVWWIGCIELDRVESFNPRTARGNGDARIEVFVLVGWPEEVYKSPKVLLQYSIPIEKWIPHWMNIVFYLWWRDDYGQAKIPLA